LFVSPSFLLTNQNPGIGIGKGKKKKKKKRNLNYKIGMCPLSI